MGTIWFQDISAGLATAVVDGAIVARRAVTRVLVALLAAYLRHQSRGQLAALDDRALADIGLTRLDVMRECDKPFWR
ncbi:MAG: DUF1127 domain-containing protein [Alphaproteobacteria bacterium]|nr:DUF1127 domain-containing protein [Alphaproteobacteria bacterium]